MPFLRAAFLTVCLALPAKAAEVTVFAAASMGDALADLTDLWEDETGAATTLVLAGSSALARQIEAGAPADLFLSANEDWMDWLEDQGRIDADTRRDVAANRLVLVTGDPAFASDAEITSEIDIAARLGTDGRMAIALPEAVPAGIYGRLALTKLGLWDALQTRLAPTDNVRAALALVALGEAPLGIVYATDARAEPRVHVAGFFPENTHPPILYPAAVVTGSASRASAEEFLTWLSSDRAQEVLARHGFLQPDRAE